MDVVQVTAWIPFVDANEVNGTLQVSRQLLRPAHKRLSRERVKFVIYLSIDSIPARLQRELIDMAVLLNMFVAGEVPGMWK